MLVFVSVFKVYACMHLFSLSFCHELNKVYSLSNIIVAKHYTPLYSSRALAKILLRQGTHNEEAS